ncbi:MAG: YkgJ family cysteine cluster protein [Polyangiaceae bacterium]|nr:YkgJ family cysteine cluster protein [Polyangiaceae bacterium]
MGRLNEANIAHAVRDGVSDVLRTNPTTQSLGDDAFRFFEEALAQVEERIPPTRPRACETGCAYCCHLKVAVTPLEALRVVSALRKSLDGAALAALAAKIRDADARTHGLTTDARVLAKEPCPLLGEDKRCIAYEARPVACAGANSFDREQCRAGFESTRGDVDIEYYGLQPRTAAAARAGAAAALFERGLDGRILELVAALRVALDDPKAEERWRRGEPVFEPAVDRELEGS